MTNSDKDREQGDSDDRSETQEAESWSGEDEQWIEDLAQNLEIGSAKTQGHDDTSENAEEESSTLSPHQRVLVHDLCDYGYPHTEICKIMGLSEGSVDPYEMKQRDEIANIMMSHSGDTEGEYAPE